MESSAQTSTPGARPQESDQRDISNPERDDTTSQAGTAPIGRAATDYESLKTPVPSLTEITATIEKLSLPGGLRRGQTPLKAEAVNQSKLSELQRMLEEQDKAVQKVEQSHRELQEDIANVKSGQIQIKNAIGDLGLSRAHTGSK